MEQGLSSEDMAVMEERRAGYVKQGQHGTHEDKRTHGNKPHLSFSGTHIGL